MKIYFIRHGESEANIKKIFSNRGLKHGLTLNGVAQVKKAVKILSKFKIDLIYSSPLLRAQQTTEIIQQALMCNAEIAEELKEADSGLENKFDNESWQTHFEIMQQWLSGYNLDKKINDGESFLEIKTRFLPLINKTINLENNVLMVGHGASFSLMFPIIFENIDNDFIMNNHLPNCSLVIGEKRFEKLYCIEWCGKKI